MKKAATKLKEPNDELTEEETINNFWDAWRKYQTISLDLAGILFVNAVLQYKHGLKAYQKFEKESIKYKQIYDKRLQKYPLNSEDFYTFMLPKLRSIELKYEPVVRYFSTCKILLVCCAETYINEIATARFTGRHFQEFDKLSIVGKWIFMQDFLKLKTKLSVDRNPLQDFVSLVTERNKLVHFKGIRKTLNPYTVPDFLEKLKLTPKDCQRNIQGVKGIIEKISLYWKGSSGPGWTDIVEEEDYRNPCFYIGTIEVPMNLYSKHIDKGRYGKE